MAYQAFDLTGKVALVTGGNGGIGLGMAEAVAAAGAGVCVWGTNAEKNAVAVEKLKAHGTPVVSFVCDVTDEAQVAQRFQDTLTEFGRIDACFANAGVIAPPTSFLKMSSEDWRRVLNVNLDGVFYTFRTAAQHMVERAKNNDPGGRLIATASIAAISGAARNEHYAVTKGGLVSMIKALAVEFAHYGITANALLPGWVETDMTADFFNSPKFSSVVKSRIPAGRWGKPEDFGALAIYLMSTASAYHTGDTIRIDGGYCVF
ncbi:MAG: SDR family oxidoreductase [Candidatus Competibacteraceae bacterium]|jgi:NAD(P)-dependent dehydrogenase (short-subunit alcohol dehydrogenase family)|nr:SDR family oxidoreductase [Candidatus Competibacteraceae bacterium]